MKRIIVLLLFLSSSMLDAQEKLGRPFFTGELNFSLAINEFYTVEPNDGEPLIVPSGLFLRLGFGYEFFKKVAVSVNAGFDDHWNYDTNAFPAYVGLRYNIFERDDEAFFADFRYGKMWRPSSNYPDGNYYGFGLGFQGESDSRWHPVFRLEFHRKGILGFENDRIDSISLGIGFVFF
ncbi:MAG: hypothetical protein CMB99_03120 [Flavobacteriaceae bacterium]|nr:hypothetical protein [Flavobacteriaceae bacterium]